MYIVYSNCDEAIVCTAKAEKKTLEEWFVNGKRDLDDYDREEFNGNAVSICPIVAVRG